MSTAASPRIRSLALVTGATSGIGRAVAENLAHAGVNLVINARSARDLEACAERWRACGIEVHPVAADLSEARAVEHLWASTVALAESRDFRFDILVNNAGFGAFGPDASIDEDVLVRMLRLNAEALMRLTHRAARRFTETGTPSAPARILNIASTAAFQSIPYFAHYAATKAFVLSYSEAIASELDASTRGRVTLTTCAPGPVRTGFGVAAGLREDSPFDRQAMDAGVVAKEALRALRAGERLVVCGGLNRFGAVLAQLAPRRLATRIAGALLSKMK